MAGMETILGGVVGGNVNSPWTTPEDVAEDVQRHLQALSVMLPSEECDKVGAVSWTQDADGQLINVGVCNPRSESGEGEGEASSRVVVYPDGRGYRLASSRPDRYMVAYATEDGVEASVWTAAGANPDGAGSRFDLSGKYTNPDQVHALAAGVLWRVGAAVSAECAHKGGPAHTMVYNEVSRAIEHMNYVLGSPSMVGAKSKVNEEGGGGELVVYRDASGGVDTIKHEVLVQGRSIGVGRAGRAGRAGSDVMVLNGVRSGLRRGPGAVKPDSYGQETVQLVLTPEGSLVAAREDISALHGADSETDCTVVTYDYSVVAARGVARHMLDTLWRGIAAAEPLVCTESKYPAERPVETPKELDLRVQEALEGGAGNKLGNNRRQNPGNSWKPRGNR